MYVFKTVLEISTKIHFPELVSHAAILVQLATKMMDLYA